LTVELIRLSTAEARRIGIQTAKSRRKAIRPAADTAVARSPAARWAPSSEPPRAEEKARPSAQEREPRAGAGDPVGPSQPAVLKAEPGLLSSRAAGDDCRALEKLVDRFGDLAQAWGSPQWLVAGDNLTARTLDVRP